MSLEVRIASPCEEPWESMQGDARVRHCARCNLDVFNVQALSEPEVRALLVKTDGRLCGRVYQRRDGTVLTRDCPTGVARLRKKALAAVALAATLALAVIGFRLGAERSGPVPDPGGGWFSRLFDPRLLAAREALRDTRTFGPLIDELFPARPAVMGRMVMIRTGRGP